MEKLRYVPVKFKGRNLHRPLMVVKKEGNMLLGRDWFSPLGIEITGLHRFRNNWEDIGARFPDVFSDSFPGAALPPIHIELNQSRRSTQVLEMPQRSVCAQG